MNDPFVLSVALVVGAIVLAMILYPRLHVRLGGVLEIDAWRPSRRPGQGKGKRRG